MEEEMCIDKIGFFENGIRTVLQEGDTLFLSEAGTEQCRLSWRRKEAFSRCTLRGTDDKLSLPNLHPDVLHELLELMLSLFNLQVSLPEKINNFHKFEVRATLK